MWEKFVPCGRWGRQSVCFLLRRTPLGWNEVTSVCRRCNRRPCDSRASLTNLVSSTQDAPSACKDALTYTVQHAPYQERGARAGVLCQNSICEISPSAHTISLTVLRNETVLVEESVYVPAVGEESEFCYFQFASLMGLFIDFLIPVWASVRCSRAL